MRKKPALFWAIVGIVALLGTAGCMLPAAPKGAIVKGRVVSAAGNGLSGRDVALLLGELGLNPMNLPTFTEVAKVVSDVDGKFSFRVDGGRAYIVEVRRPDGWAEHREPVDMDLLSKTGTIDLEIDLGVKPYVEIHQQKSKG